MPKYGKQSRVLSVTYLSEEVFNGQVIWQQFTAIDQSLVACSLQRNTFSQLQTERSDYKGDICTYTQMYIVVYTGTIQCIDLHRCVTHN